MKRALAAAAVIAFVVTARSAGATPSTVDWTPATTYTQPYLVPHLTYDTYVSERGALQNTYGLTLGVLPFEKLQGEVGFDFFLPTPGLGAFDFLQLNAKVTVPEKALAKWAPGVSFGIMNAGFKEDVSNYNCLHLDVGKTFSVGTFAVGGYYGAGSRALWTGSDGNENRAGVMASYTSPDWVIDRPGLQKINFVIDGATGKNWFGAVAPGAVIYFTPAIDLITGPVFFLDSDLYNATYGSDFMWTFQIDVDFDLIKKKK